MKSPKESMAVLRASDRIRIMPNTIKLMSAFLLVGGIAFLDYLTGNEISFSIFYILPVFGTSWLVGRRWGVVLALVSSFLWLLADLYSGPHFSHYLIPVWNALVRLVFFFVIGVSVPFLRLELAHSMKAIDRLTSLLPVCAWCRNIRNDTGDWSTMEEFLEHHTNSEVTHGICPVCIAKYFPRQAEEESRAAAPVQPNVNDYKGEYSL